MTNAQSFPLCRIPSVACDCIVKQMNLREKYILSTLSKRAGRAVKVAILREVYKLCIRIDPDYAEVSIKNELSPPREDWLDVGFCLIGGTQTTDDDDTSEVRPIWTNDIRSTLIAKLESITEVFKCELPTLELTDQFAPPDILQHILPVFRERKLEVYSIDIESFTPNNELFEYVMDTFRDVDTMISRVYTTEDFGWKETKPSNVTRCTFRANSWLTIDHLTRLFSNCRSLSLDDLESPTTPICLNAFLKLWIEGSTLEHAELTVRHNFAIASILDGIDHEPVQEAYIQNRLLRFPDGVMFKIRQKNGVEAVIFVNGGRLLTLSTHFDDPKNNLWTDDEGDDEEEEGDDEMDEEEVVDEEIEDE